MFSVPPSVARAMFMLMAVLFAVAVYEQIWVLAVHGAWGLGLAAYLTKATERTAHR